jgi:hypothetical protein
LTVRLDLGLLHMIPGVKRSNKVKRGKECMKVFFCFTICRNNID